MAEQFQSDRNQVAPVEPTCDEAPARETERKLGLSMLMKVALAVAVLASLIISIACVMKANELQRQSREMEQQIAEYNEKIDRLRYYLGKENMSDEDIIAYAREYLNLYFPDEDIYYNDVND